MLLQAASHLFQCMPLLAWSTAGWQPLSPVHAVGHLFQGRPFHPAGNTVIVDIRTAGEKDSAGIPDLPSGGKLIEVQFADIGDRRVRGQLKDPSAIERKVGGQRSFTCAGDHNVPAAGVPWQDIWVMTGTGDSQRTPAQFMARRAFLAAHSHALAPRSHCSCHGSFVPWQGAMICTLLLVVLCGPAGTGFMLCGCRCRWAHSAPAGPWIQSAMSSPAGANGLTGRPACGAASRCSECRVAPALGSAWHQAAPAQHMMRKPCCPVSGVGMCCSLRGAVDYVAPKGKGRTLYVM